MTSYCWSARTTPFGPSDYQGVVRELLEEWGEPAPPWRDKPERGAPQPLRRRGPLATLARRPGHGAEVERRLDAAAALVRAADPEAPDDGLDMVAGRAGGRLGRRDRSGCSPRPGRERAREIEVPLPRSLSATALLRLREDPEAFARDLARPMPRPPSPRGPLRHPLPRLGRGAASASSRCSTPTTCPGRADLGIDDDADLDATDRRLRGGAVRRPGAARGRGAVRARARRARWCAAAIDAVYAERRRASCSSTGRPGGGLDRPAAARDLPRGVGRARRRAPRAGAGRRSTTCAPASWSSRRTCPAGPSWRPWSPGSPPPQSVPRAAPRAISTIAPKVCSRSCDVVSSPVTMWSETVQIASARAAVPARRGCRARGLHLDRQHAVVDHPRGQLGPRAVERVARRRSARRARRASRPSPCAASYADRSRPKSATGA